MISSPTSADVRLAVLVIVGTGTNTGGVSGGGGTFGGVSSAATFRTT